MGIQTLAHYNTAFAQLLKFVPRHEFEAPRQSAPQGPEIAQNVPLVTVRCAQPGAVRRPRDTVSNLSVQAAELPSFTTLAARACSAARVFSPLTASSDTLALNCGE